MNFQGRELYDLLRKAFVRFENKEVLDTDKSKVIGGIHKCNSTTI
jgi:hypothetical protein